MKDKEGYLLIEKEFVFHGFNFKLVKDFKDGWMIYEKSKPDRIHKKYELIKPKKQEEFIFNGKKIEAKWVYPNNNQFGRTGFDCVSLDIAVERHEEILKNKEHEEIEEKLRSEELRIPNGKFTIKDLQKANPKLNYSIIYSKVKELLDQKKIKSCGVKENKKGRASNLYIKK